MTLLWVTRTQPGAQELADQAQAQGLSVMVAPLVGVVASLAWQDVEAPPPDLIIVTSRHALAPFFASALGQQAQSVPYIALGSGSANGLRAQGVDVEVPTGVGSESVLEMPRLTRLPVGSVVWLIGGEGGRGVLPKALKARGMQVVKLDFYRRQSLQPDLDAGADIKWIEISSLAALEGLAAFPEYRGAQLIVPSLRLFELAQSAGFKAVQAANPTTAAVVEVVRKGDNLT